MKNSGLYTPESLAEEALVIMGRVNAFAVYVRNQKYSIDREVCAALLGFDLEDNPIEESEAEVGACRTLE